MSELKQFLDTNGDKVRGDHLFTAQNLERLYSHAMDHCRTANGWSGDITKANEVISQEGRCHGCWIFLTFWCSGLAPAVCFKFEVPPAA